MIYCSTPGELNEHLKAPNPTNKETENLCVKYNSSARNINSAVAQGWSFGLSTKRTRVRILCRGDKTFGKFFHTLHCSSSLSCIHEYVAIDKWYMNSFRALIAAYGWMLPREIQMVFD